MHLHSNRRTWIAAAMSLLLGATALSQGIPTSTLSGRVTNDGQGLPGVTVTIKSPNLQGARTATTTLNGDYVFPNLPPGEYAVAFDLSGFEAQSRTVRLAASQASTVDVNLALKAIAAAVEAIATPSDAVAISQDATAAATFSKGLVEKLPTARTFASYVNLAPGLNSNGPAGVYSISGAMSYDNLMTINGVQVQDNVYGNNFDLYIEDAVQETTVQTGAISAEFGRFTGGVINAITKSGGNDFHGSFRVNLTNDSWGTTTPSNETLQDKVNPRYEATLGGPIWKDRVWFFGAGRLEKEKTTGTTSFTNISYPFVDDEKRYEANLTITPVANHTAKGSYIRVDEKNQNFNFGTILDTDSLFTPKFPQELLAVNYSGTLSSNVFVEAQYSNRKFTYEDYGSPYTDLIRGTLMRDQSRGNARYHTPTFCGGCDPESRDIEEFLLKGTYFLSTPSLGSHTIVGGFDRFVGKVKANNYQSGSNYRVFGTGAIIRGTDIFPVFDSSTYFGYTPIEVLSQGSRLRTDSVFLNDSWRLSNRLSFNLGVRYDENLSKDSRRVTTADDHNWSPRVAATFDVKGDGKIRVTGSYARYVAAIQETMANAASNAGSPSAFYWYYDGPEVNTDPTAPLVSTQDALRRFFDYIFSKGCPDLAACDLPLAYAAVPGVNLQIRGNLTSPGVDEYTLSVAGQVGTRLTYRADLIRRDFANFYGQRTDRSTGTVFDSLGNEYDLTLVENTDGYRREYTALQLQAGFRAANRLNLGANWTWSHLIGNLVGETGTSGPVAGGLAQYPEYRDERWFAPVGDLATDQRHKIRAWAIFDVPLPKAFGALSVAAFHQLDTGTPYGAAGNVNVARYVTNPGYVAPPTNNTYWFTSRNAFRTETVNRTDVSLNYGFRAGPIELFLQPQVINVFNNSAVIAVNTTVETAATRQNDYVRFNPFTQTPTQGIRGSGANWNYGPNFGKPRNAADYQTPRAFRVSLGVRF